MCGENARQASTDRTVVNILRLLYFIDLIFLSFVLAFSDFPGPRSPALAGGSGTVLIMSSHLLTSVSKRFSKNAIDASRKMSGEVLHENQVLPARINSYGFRKASCHDGSGRRKNLFSLP